jgi:hydroxymethylpyrimidine/phosphomethylpyrimidine kinase
MQTVLTIAGFDPSSGAGVTADLMVFAAHGLFGTACITGLTVQSTVGVQSIHPTAGAVIEATLDCLESDLPPAGIKIGMLTSSSNLHRICDYLTKYLGKHEERGDRRPIVVFDPVLRSSSGRELIDSEGVTVLRERLLPLLDWITPNLDELTELAGRSVSKQEKVPDACRELQARVAQNFAGRRLGILATGGHLDPPDDFLLMPSGEELWLTGQRVTTRSTHGTGCAFSSAFLSRLVLGDSPSVAARAAKNYVAGALRTAVSLGSGNGPMNLLWPLLKPSH